VFKQPIAVNVVLRYKVSLKVKTKGDNGGCDLVSWLI